MKERNFNALKKISDLAEWGIPFINTRCGIIIDEKIMIAKNRSRWKKLGELNWYPYYGLKNLVEALYDDALDEYAEEQQNSGRTQMSPPINHKWKDEQKEKEYRNFYEGSTA
jgi:hypothetical protein